MAASKKEGMRRKIFGIAALVVVASATLLFVVVRPLAHRVTIKTYFANVGGLRSGGAVRIAGVEMGSVRRIRVRPELGAEPVEVEMVLTPPYEIKIPSDSIVSLETAGVLGSTYAEIDITHASGTPIGANAVLKSRSPAPMTQEQLIEYVLKLLDKKKCDCRTQTEDSEPSPATARRIAPK